jgi:hypothetical protein
MVLGIQSATIYEKEKYTQWAQLATEIQKLKGIKGVLSIGKLFELQKDTLNQKFTVNPVPATPVQTDAEMDSLKNKIQAMPFYNGFYSTRRVMLRLWR